jgi:outer membrane protein TolC
MRTLTRAAHSGLLVAILAGSFTAESLAFAQTPPPAPPAAPPAAPASSAPVQGTATTPPNAGEGRPASADQIPIDPKGLTADTVGARARATSFSAKAQAEALRAAAARVDQAWVNYLPRLTAQASYTRLSDFTPPVLFSGLVVSPNGPGSVTTTDPTTKVTTLNSGTNLIVAGPSGFGLVLNNYSLSAGIVVPISDYFLRIGEGYTASINAEDAARYDYAGAAANAEANGRIAFYSWARAKGAVTVAEQALNDQKTHLQDAKNQFTVGNASKADVLRAETGVASAELVLERARNLEVLTARQVKVAIHADDETPIATAEDVMTKAPPVTLTLLQASQEAQSNRAELKSLSANVEALKRSANVTRAGYYPTLGAFADATYANPNQRRFPATDEWFPTWDLGARLSWSPNDALGTRSAAADAEAKISSLEAQKQSAMDGITLEVQQAWTAVKESDYAIETTARQVTSATEAYRVARELFNAGRATSTTLTDAETELVRARLEVLNANVDAKTARVRLEHAIGRDAKVPQAPKH